MIIHVEDTGYRDFKIVSEPPSTWEIEVAYYVVDEFPVLWLDIFVGLNISFGYVSTYYNLDMKPKFFIL